MKWNPVIIALVFAFTYPATAGPPIPGPVEVEVVRTIDGDTIAIEARVWPGLIARENVRVAGVDTPELRGKCDAERDAARLARDYVELHTVEGVTLHDIGRDKYGRILARVEIDGVDLAEMLIVAGLGRPYDGGRRLGWCTD